MSTPVASAFRRRQPAKPVASGIGDALRARPQNRKPAESVSTQDRRYTDLLLIKESPWWKKVFDAQAPYRWHLRRLNLGLTLDIGCGLGRNLINLMGKGVGIDHNPHSVEIARSRGLVAFTPPEFQSSLFNRAHRFDSMLLSHVAEHLVEGEVVELLTAHIPLLKPNGRVILICPQDYGYRSDPTHVQFMDFTKLRGIACEAGLIPVREYSFPFPRVFGHLFKYNEFVSISRKGHV
jgi:SAM-dependent methyltransferase